jgi:hypothetical protein
LWNGVRVSDLMPYTWFVRIPGLSSFREADRLAILGLLPAALLAGAAVDWLRYHARPLIAVVAAAAVLEAGYAGSAKVGKMPTSYPAADKAIAADHSRSIVLDLPFGLRGGIPVDGVPFFPKALVMATADGHPRSIAYTSRLPLKTKYAINNHPFYADLIAIQHEVPLTCPWRAPDRAETVSGCLHPYGVSVPGAWAVPTKTNVAAVNTPAELAEARRDAARMNIGWAVVWKRNGSVSNFVLPYLRATGFHFVYRTCGKDAVLVYQRSAHPLPANPNCVR